MIGGRFLQRLDILFSKTGNFLIFIFNDPDDHICKLSGKSMFIIKNSRTHSLKIRRKNIIFLF